MNNLLDWLLAFAVGALLLMAAHRLVTDGSFEPLPLSFSVALLIGARSLHHHLPKLIAAIRPKR